MGSIRVRRGAQWLTIDENMRGSELKRQLGVSPNSILMNARNEMIGDNERVAEKVRDGEEIATKPNFIYW